MKFKTFVILFFAWSATLQSRASGGAEHIGFVSTNFVTTNVAFSDTIYFSTYLKNYHNSPFNDTIDFKVSVNGGLVTADSLFFFSRSGQTIHLDPGDSISASFKLVVTQTYFAVGPNGLVVWPIVRPQDTLDVHDSIMQQIEIITTSSIRMQESNSRVWVSNQQLHVTDNGDLDVVGEVKLINHVGEVVRATKGYLPLEIPVNGLPVGLYYAEVLFATDKAKTIKVYIP